jgi:Outer membrane protein beta-barrel domain
MKKIALVCFLGLAALTAEAQTRFGIKAGLNLSDVNGKSDGRSFNSDTKMKPSFHVGVIADFSISENVFVQPGILASSKGFKIEQSGITASTSPLYVEVPVNIGFRTELSDNLKFYVMGGPYVGIGVAGNSKISGSGQSETETINWGNDENDSDYKRLDYGVNVGVGVEVSNFLIGAQYGLGLANVFPGGDKDNSFKNAVIGISVGYLFGGN